MSGATPRSRRAGCFHQSPCRQADSVRPVPVCALRAGESGARTSRSARRRPGDAVFTSDTGMAAVWLSWSVRMDGDQRLLASPGQPSRGSTRKTRPRILLAAAFFRAGDGPR